jgi:PIN domain nuclease of toxin-antitoxin system
VILLVDANALLWVFADDGTLAMDAGRAMQDPANEVLVSAATIWEIEVKRAAGRLRAPDQLLDAVAAADMTAIAFTPADALEAARLPRHHGDPFDRMLVAQAVRLGAVVVSRDSVFDAYGIDRLSA